MVSLSQLVYKPDLRETANKMQMVLADVLHVLGKI